MTLRINREQAEAAVAEIVAEVGDDHIYNAGGQDSCSYADEVDRTAPGCIVGHLVAKLSPEDFPKLIEWEDNEVERGHSGGTAVVDVPNAILSPKDDSTQKFLMELQRMQDRGNTWGESLDFARRNA